MSSPAQMEANRRNSLLSTGPASEAGKAVSRTNAVKSGFYCSKVVVIRGEDPAEYEAVAANYQRQYQPVTQTEQYLVDRLIADDWRLRRYIKAETDLWSQNPEPAFALSENIALIRLYRIITNTQREYMIALKELERQIAGRPAAESPNESKVESTMESPIVEHTEVPPTTTAPEPPSSQPENGFVPAAAASASAPQSKSAPVAAPAAPRSVSKPQNQARWDNPALRL